MEKLLKNVRKYPQKPEWKILLDYLIYSDSVILYRICRKMIIALQRMKVPEIVNLLEELNPSKNFGFIEQDIGVNWPKPKGSPFDPELLVNRIFEIADSYLSDEQMTDLLKQWITQENLAFLSIVLERRDAPLYEVNESVNKFMRMTNNEPVLSFNERHGIVVNLIQRLLSENLNYINIAKNFMSLEFLAGLMKNIVGPSSGNGKVGGKSAGLILACQILTSKKKNNPLLEHIRTPRSWFITSDTMTNFMHYNALEEFYHTKYLNQEEIKLEHPFVEYILKNSHFQPEIIKAFHGILDDFTGKPLIIRSSSLLEDSFEASFSGKYKSLFISNQGSKEERLLALMNAVAEVYSSTFGPDPMAYRKERGLLDFREEMGILIQEVVGTKVGIYFLPSYAGVAFSHNEFRWSPRIEREDGIVRLVAGLGTRAVDRTINDYPVLVSPGKPSLKVNSSVEEKLKYSQKYLDVINLETNKFETIEFSKLIATSKGMIPYIDKMVSFDRGGTLVEPLGTFSDFAAEDLLITFNNLIDKTTFIFKIKEILKHLQDTFDRPVDIEFACDGQDLYILQCRPQSKFLKEREIRLPTNIPDSAKLFTANLHVSSGVVRDIKFIVYVDSFEYSLLSTNDEMLEVGKIVSSLNRILPERKFILIGPGRWGSKGDIKLGVPVIYSDINKTSMLIEVAKETEGYVPELSFGTHFFQDLVEANIKYLPLYPDKKGNIFNEGFFLKSENQLTKINKEFENLQHVIKVIDVPKTTNGKTASVYMDGDNCMAIGFIE